MAWSTTGMTNTNTANATPRANASRATWATYMRDTFHVNVPDTITRNDIRDAAPWFHGDDAPMPTWFDPSMVVTNAPSGVVIRTDITGRDVLGTHYPRWIDPDTDTTVVTGAFGTNATLDVASPGRGVGRGYVRPFIRDTVTTGHAPNNGDNGDGTMTCRNGDACVHPDGPTMSVRRFPTLSTPTADGRTRADRCRACRDAR